MTSYQFLMTTLINGQVHLESSSTAGGESHLCTLVSAVTLLCSSSVSSHHPLLTHKTVEPRLELLLPSGKYCFVTRQSSVAPDWSVLCSRGLVLFETLCYFTPYMVSWLAFKSTVIDKIGVLSRWLRG